jgi:hypothetical protein
MVTTTLLVDGMLSGTGIRDALEGGYLQPRELNLSPAFSNALASWVLRYAEMHYAGYKDAAAIAALDKEGMALRDQLEAERPDHVVGYYSDALSKRLDSFPHV